MKNCKDKATSPMSQILRPEVLRAFFGSFGTLRPVQEAAFAPILEGKDVLLLSPTGSGKTEAALAPLIDRWYSTLRGEAGIFLVYISPTKALINDLRHRLEPPLATLGVGLGIRHGDHSDVDGRRPPPILVTTPESLDVMLARRGEILSEVRAVVIDEVHLLYNSQRGLQLSILLHRLASRAGRVLQIVGLSASVGNPSDLTLFLFGTGITGGVQIISDTTRKPISGHVRLLRDPRDLLQVVERIMGLGPAKILLFVDSRRQCDAISALLRESPRLRETVYVHYSSLAPDLREETERRFAAQRQAICVATSTLELGIDIGDIDVVLLFRPPANPESFLQRIGRGNRRTGQTRVVCLVPPESPQPLLEVLAHLALLERVMAGRLEREKPLALYGAAIQQMLSYLHSRHGAFTKVAEFAALFSAQGHIDRSKVEGMLSHLVDMGVLTSHGFKREFGAGEGFHKLANLRLLFGNYPATSQGVAVYEANRELGTIPIINLLRLELGSRFRFAGRVWEVRRLQRDRIDVRPSDPQSRALDIIYRNSGHEWDALVLEDVWSLLEGGRVNYDLFTPTDRQWVEDRVKPLRDALADGGIPMVHGPNGVKYLTFGGSQVNRAVAAVLEGECIAADALCLHTVRPVDFSSIPSLPEGFQRFLAAFTKEDGATTLFQSLLPLELLREEFTETWLKTPAHARALTRLRNGKPRAIPGVTLEGLA